MADQIEDIIGTTGHSPRSSERPAGRTRHRHHGHAIRDRRLSAQRALRIGLVLVDSRQLAIFNSSFLCSTSSPGRSSADPVGDNAFLLAFVAADYGVSTKESITALNSANVSSGPLYPSGCASHNASTITMEPSMSKLQTSITSSG